MKPAVDVAAGLQTCAIMTNLRKSPRLKDFDYLGPLACHLTFVTRQRRPLFSNVKLAEICLQHLHESCARWSIVLTAYCFMPDHVHILVEVPEGASLTQFVRHFKQVSGYALKNQTGGPAWQISYYDHILRKEEAILDVARYIWENPVKEGLVEEPLDYALSGPRELMEAELELGSSAQT